ncbi:cyclic AMP-responsive element-binding protein 3-like protein 4 isoform X2 [Venturia canescens]|uniref:cyclic AMP-responsive element-binding protein 3-like protein 4 isoform X2 n=1 Tax=Venturia canescens TaxID=32260 RepID=UPI001C9CFB40|nr:cyclic AMP-responsive element-binding protein 3-like protein 4 isoform X2 [Venturia canescens]
MTSISTDMSFMDLLLDREDPLLKDSLKDEIITEENYRDDPIAAEEWPTSTDDLFDSIFKLDNQFNLIENDLDEMPSSSSDSGLSSVLSLSCEQQLSPLLPIEEDQIEMSNSNLGSPPNFMDFDSLGSPNQSLDESSPADSPIRSVMSSSSIGSPATPLDTDLNESMDFQPSLLTLVDPNLVEDHNVPATGNAPVAASHLSSDHGDQRGPILERVSTPKQQTPRAETTVNIRNFTCNGKRNIRQLIRVTPVGSGNPRSILLPVNLKDMKEVRTIKIINASQARNLKGFKINQGSVISKAIPMSIGVNIKQEETGSERSSGNSGDDVSETESTPYPRLKLNSEEKRLLQKEGISLPSHYPLTKHEERELKRIRRKIRNKISAQDSRKRKKEYVDGLEDRVKQCTEENMSLLKRIKALQTQNQSLAGQLKRLQALIQKGNKSAQPATCLMVLLLSLALVAAPSLRPHSNNNSANELASRDTEQPEKMPPIAGRSRSLLHTKQLDDELQQYSDELLQEVEGLIDHDYVPAAVTMPPYKRARYELEHTRNSKYAASPSEHIGGTLNPKIDYPIPKFTKKFFEPPLDDVWPPPSKPGGGIQPATKVVDKLEALTNELKINISDSDGTRTILLKVPPPPHEQLNSST